MRRLLSAILLMVPICLFAQHEMPIHDDPGWEPKPFQGSVSGMFHPSQVYAPNAANLGVYGKVPVNYNTGSADVQIPIAELNGKDCTQSVCISYKTGGHRVSEVPGPFGLGWTLHAGGCINRIVHGEKDEMTQEEMEYLTESSRTEAWEEFLDSTNLSVPGYLYHPEAVQSSDYNYSAFFYPHYYDMAPDEFQICADGISGSFYIGKNGTPLFVSKTPNSYKISYETETKLAPEVLYRVNGYEIKVHYFTYISKIIVIDNRGVKYTFGGDMSSIDFSFTPKNTPSFSYHHTKEDKKALENMSLDEMERAYWDTYPSIVDPRVIATANTWHLVSKEFPMTGEKIIFSYEKKGYPIHISDVNNRFIVLTNDRTMADATAINPNGDIRIWENLSFTDDREKTINHILPKTNLSYTILHPSYLSKIKSEKTKDEIQFSYEWLDGLKYYPNDSDFGQVFGIGSTGSYVFTSRENKYYTATMVRSSKGTVYLQYTRDESGELVGGEIMEASIHDNPLSFLSGVQQRPHALHEPEILETPSIKPMSAIAPEENMRYRIHLAKVILCGGTSAQREYSMQYNKTRLPDFDAKVSDHWGYYNGHGWGSLLSTTYNQNVIMSDFFCEQTVDNWFNERRVATDLGIAESLEKITYPTGGSTTFVYEPHQYNKVAEIYPKRISREFGTAGGFRIKEIIDSDGTKAEVRSFTYNDSGILNGKPKYGAVGYYAPENTDEIEEQESYVGWASQFKLYSKYRMAGEGCINQIPTFSGSHIAYSHVTEHLADGASIDYKYSDWEEYPDIKAETYHSYKAKDLMNPFTSCDMMRGLLKEVSYRNADGVVVQKEEMTYRDSVCIPEVYGDLSTGLFSYENRRIYPSDSPWYNKLSRVYRFFPTPPYEYDNMPYFFRLSRCYIFGKSPYLLQKKVTTWSTDGRNPITVTTQYEYNSRNQIVSEKTTGASITEHRTRWSGDIENGQYEGMTELGMTGFPIEETVVENGKVVSSTLHEYGLTSGERYQHLADYRSMSQSGIIAGDFFPYNGLNKDASYGSTPEVTYSYDMDGNMIRSLQRNETAATVIWGYNGTSPVMVSSAKDVSSIAYYPFEDDNDTQSFASYWDDGFHSPGCHVGAFSVPLPNVPEIDVYVIDYMVKFGDIWAYRRQEVDASSSTFTIDEGYYPIDNVRVYPKGEEAVSYTWFPKVGVRSSTDGAGKTVSYEYDVNGRLQAIYDVDGNPVTGFYYKYDTSETR